jgi:hypothetical protein
MSVLSGIMRLIRPIDSYNYNYHNSLGSCNIADINSANNYPNIYNTMHDNYLTSPSDRFNQETTLFYNYNSPTNDFNSHDRFNSSYDSYTNF